MLSRRSFGLGALGAALMTFAAGAAANSTRRFLFVHAVGGWDPLIAFAPMFDAPLIDMEMEASRMTVGNFDLVDGPGRPAVREYFERFGDQTVLLNGLSTRSVNHFACQNMALTGSLSDSAPDWATLLGVAAADDYHLPHLVMSGPIYPGPHSVVVGHAQGLLQQTVHNTLHEFADQPLVPPGDQATALVDDYLLTRAAEFPAYDAALSRAQKLVGAKQLVQFQQAQSVDGQVDNAISMLANGVARCATIDTEADWDTHDDNSLQMGLHQQLFTLLAYVHERLAASNLADDTVVVVVSEMGRTPAYNETFGRDHWPYTSALITGPGLVGGRAIGGYTDGFEGIGVDPASGDLDPTRPGISAEDFGATILALGGVEAPSGEAISGILTDPMGS